MEDVHLWMIDQHLGRRSVSDFQRGVLALRKREIVAERRARAQLPLWRAMRKQKRSLAESLPEACGGPAYMPPTLEQPRSHCQAPPA